VPRRLSEAETIPVAGPGHRAKAQPGGLSPREREVAALLARGFSNPQIADQLAMTQRTVAAHIEHILDKLGFAWHTQIGVWAAEHDLAGRGRH
jgi:DNA-binding NarL/FixJ family response regulator